MEGPPQAKIQSETELREASLTGAPEGREDRGKEEGDWREGPGQAWCPRKVMRTKPGYE